MGIYLTRIVFIVEKRYIYIRMNCKHAIDKNVRKYDSINGFSPKVFPFACVPSWLSAVDKIVSMIELEIEHLFPLQQSFLRIFLFLIQNWFVGYVFVFFLHLFWQPIMEYCGAARF